MKNIILFVTMLLFSSCSTLMISVDRIERNGDRQVMSETKSVNIEGAEYSIGLKAYQNPYTQNVDWLLLVSSFYYIPDDGAVLLKLGNNETIYLPINNLNIGEVNMPSYGSSSSYKRDYYSSVYSLSEKDLADIAQYGILKIRISSKNVYRERSWKSDILGKYLIYCKDVIYRRLVTTSLKKKSLWDEF